MLKPPLEACARTILSILAISWVTAAPLFASSIRLYDPLPIRNDEMGFSVAADAGVAVVGIRLADNPENSGSILVFDSTTGPGWPVFGPFKSPTPTVNGEFGRDLAYRDGEIFVGNGDKVYRLVRDPLLAGNWIHTSEILPPANAQSFGWALAVSGDDLVVGEPTGLVGTNQPCGRAHVYHFEAGAWSLQGTLETPSDCPPAPGSDSFGFSVSISGDTVAVGTLVGKVHLFNRVAGVWQHELKIDPAPEAEDDFSEFGRAVAIDGERLLAGSGKLTASSDPGNRAYIYERTSPGHWTQAAVLIANVPTPILQHGYAVALRGDLAAVGSTKVNLAAPGFPAVAGAVYLFGRQADGSWPQIRRDVGIQCLAFGSALDFDGDTLWVGDPLATFNNMCCYGAAYTIELGPVFSNGFESGNTTAWSSTVP